MKKKIFYLLSLICLVIVGFLGINSNNKTVTTSANNSYSQIGSGNSTTFDHIDIEAPASFTYYVDGKPVVVDINFYDDDTNLSKINIYRKNADGTLTEISVTGKWQNQAGSFGNSSSNKEYRISGNFDRYYDSISKKEVVYVVKFTLSVTIGGVEQELVYTEEYSYSSSNNVCPGGSDNKGIDVEITGTKLEEYFSSSLKIVKNVLNAEDSTFTFNVKAVNEDIDFDKDIQITTDESTGFITLGGLKAGEEYVVTEINIPEGYELVTEQPITITAEKNKTIEVTFTNRAKTVSISGTKTWNDNDNQDGVRPGSITVNLLKNGTKIASKEVTAEDNWAYSFNDLVEYENGEKVVYTIDEDSVEGYTTEVSGYNITNTHAPEKVSISGTKTWNDNDNQDGIRPNFITVNLLKNGVKVASKTVAANDSWTYTFTDLDKYENGEEITYTISEDSVEGYEASVQGYDITNTHAPEKVSVSGTKTWNDNDNQDGIRPESIMVRLYANGVEAASQEVTADNNWKYSFVDLDKYENGEEIAYTISEDSVDGYKASVQGYDITNTHAPEKVSVSGTKTWNDNDNQDGIRPESIMVRLYANGVEVASKEVTVADNWKYSFVDLDKYENGEEITYTISEDSVDGYNASVQGYDITNTHTPSIISLSGTKTWNDNDNQDGIRPESIIVRLLANGEEITYTEVTADNNWTYTFDNLAEYANGSKIEYTVKEDSIEGYATVINGYDITNIHEIETTIVSGTKTWADNNNQDGIRPESIIVRLYADGVEVVSKEVTADDNWAYTFSDLDKYKNGEEIIYTIAEDSVEGYTTEVSGYNITNKHTPETTMIMGKKIWDDNNDQDGVRPESITVRLLANGQEVSYVVVTEGANNDWTYAFIDLDKYKNGEEIEYTVVEDKVVEYTTTYDEENPYIIINTHQTKTIDINGAKTWDDNNNQDGLRPESIMVRLYADGVEIASKEVTETDNWKYSFNDLDMYKEGKLISYTVSEDNVENYSTVIDGYNITNKHTPEKIAVTGTKTWNDNNNQDGVRPEYIIINLLKNGVFKDTVIVSEDTDWKYSFNDLDKYENGKEIEYTLTEVTVDGYETEVNGYDITNTHEIEKITFKATKTWADNDNQDGIRPESITVRLYADGVEIASKEITETDNWTYSFNDLDKYKDGVAIVYTIIEDVVLGYDTEINYNEIDENNIVAATLINIHIPEKTEIEINKTWNDNNNALAARPDSIEVDLYANGEYLKTIVITNQEDWKYVVDGLDKYKDGEEIVYTILERAVEGYTTTYDGFNIINTFDFGKGGDVEILPPQTGVNSTDSSLSLFGIFNIFVTGLFLIIKRFI